MVDVSSDFRCVSGFSGPARCRAWRGQVADIIPCIEKKKKRGQGGVMRLASDQGEVGVL